MPDMVNPIQRLCNLLTRVVAFGEQYTQGAGGLGSSISVRSLWTAELGIDEAVEGQRLEFYRSIIEVTQLVEICEQNIRQKSPLNEKIYLDLLSKTKEIIHNVETSKWGEFRQSVNDDFLTSMRLTAGDMSFYWSEEVILSDELQNLQYEIEDLMSEVVDALIDNELKQFVIEGLESIRHSIVAYRLFGAEGMRQAVDRNLGMMFRYRQHFDEARDGGESEELLSRFLSIVWKVDTAATTATKIKELAEPAIEFFQNMLNSGA